MRGMPGEPPSEARERVLQVAEQLFSERGYTAVTLRDIANALKMKQASLYHHVPGGKEELFVEVTERGLLRHKRQLEQAIAQSPPTLPEQMRAAAHWLLSQPPVNLSRMTRSDMPAIAEEHAQRLTRIAYEALLLPLVHIFVGAGLTRPDPILLAGTFLAIVEAIHDARNYTDVPGVTMMEEMIEVLLHGLKPN